MHLCLVQLASWKGVLLRAQLVLRYSVRSASCINRLCSIDCPESSCTSRTRRSSSTRKRPSGTSDFSATPFQQVNFFRDSFRKSAPLSPDTHPNIERDCPTWAAEGLPQAAHRYPARELKNLLLIRSLSVAGPLQVPEKIRERGGRRSIQDGRSPPGFFPALPARGRSLRWQLLPHVYPRAQSWVRE